VECTEPGCRHWFHVTCAFRVGLIVSLKPNSEQLLEWSALCWQHSMGHWIDRRQAVWTTQAESRSSWLRDMIPSRAHPLTRELARCPPAVVETVYNYWLQKRKAKGKVGFPDALSNSRTLLYSWCWFVSISVLDLLVY
jgi:hypothetical protein